MNRKVVISGVDTSKLPKLTKEESQELLLRISNGDQEARQQFLYANLRLVLSIVHRFNFNEELNDDVFQVGCLGLTKALNNFDLKYRVMFSTYAVPMIIGEIRRFLRETTPLKVGRNIRDIAYKIMQARELAAENGEIEPTLEDISKEMQIPERNLQDALDALSDTISLYDPAYNDGEEGVLVMDQIADHKDIEDKWIDRLDIKRAIKGLSEKEKQVIELRYYKGKTQSEVSSYCNISQAQVSRLENNALSKLRMALS